MISWCAGQQLFGVYIICQRQLQHFCCYIFFCSCVSCERLMRTWAVQCLCFATLKLFQAKVNLKF